MYRFWESVIEPLLTRANPGVVIEIGASTGLNTKHLIEFCLPREAVLHVIDPSPRFDVPGWRQTYGDQFVMHEAKSLDALPRIGPADAVLIDGDHNWYTVFHELRLLHELADQHGRDFPLVLLHDIDWPYGRRDLYYNPDDIPEQHRNPYERAAIEPGHNGLQDAAGFNRHLFNATEEGGPHNGVATAIDDFLASHDPRPEFRRISGFHGLGILVPTSMLNANEPLRSFLKSVTPSIALAKHIKALESGRLNCEVRVQTLTQNGKAKPTDVASNGKQIVEGGHQRGRTAAG